MQAPQYATAPGQYVQNGHYSQSASAPMPTQYAPQQQSGAPNNEPVAPPSKYALLQLLPMFPLESPEAERQRQEALAHSEWFKSRIQAIPQQTAMDRVGMAFLNATTGANLINTRKIDNGAMKLASATNELMAAQIQQMILTRWTLPSEVAGEPLLVDIVEHRSMGINTYYVKTNRDANLKFRNKHTSKMKGNKSWCKKFNTTPVDHVAIIGGDKSETGLDMVLRLQRPISAAEAVPLIKGFEKQWGVPSPAWGISG